jgi:uncharacterized protein GlcG (DUF336 family)
MEKTAEWGSVIMVEANNTGIKTPRAVLNLALAKKMTVAAEAKAKEIGVPMYISVVDASANLVSVNRMEDAILVSEEISINKAYTAAAIKLPTDVVATVAQPGTSLYGIQNSSNIVIFGGGFPIKLNGRVIGGIGVSGGSVEEDMAVAEAGLQRFKEIVEGLSGDAVVTETASEKNISGSAPGDYGVNLNMARKMSVAVEQKAAEIGVPMFFSVVDKGARLILTHRMDEALLVSNEISKNKAYSAATVKLPTDVIATVSQPGTSLYGIQQVDRMIIFGGGYPLNYNGKVIGGIGVSGGSVQEDMLVAQAALDVYKAETGE